MQWFIRLLISATFAIPAISTASDWQGEISYGYQQMSWNPGGFSTSSLDYKIDPIRSQSLALGVSYHGLKVIGLSHRRSTSTESTDTLTSGTQGSGIEETRLNFLVAAITTLIGENGTWLNNLYFRYHKKQYFGEATLKRKTGPLFTYQYRDLSGSLLRIDNTNNISFSSKFSTKQLGYSFQFHAYAFQPGLFSSEWKKPVDRIEDSEEFIYTLYEAEYVVKGWEFNIKPTRLYQGIYALAEIRYGINSEVKTYRTSQPVDYQSATYGLGYTWLFSEHLSIQSGLTYNWSIFKYSNARHDSDDESEVTANLSLALQF